MLPGTIPISAGLAPQEARSTTDLGSETAAISSGATASGRQPFLFLSIQWVGSENLWCMWPVLETQGNTKRWGHGRGRRYLVGVTVTLITQHSSILCRIRKLSWATGVPQNILGDPSPNLVHLWSIYSMYFVTPWTVSRQAPLSMEFSRQEYWCGLPFPPPGEGLLHCRQILYHWATRKAHSTHRVMQRHEM